MQRRIAIAGFQHETNTFAPFNADWDDFVIADSWPGMLIGGAAMNSTRGMNRPFAGASAALEAAPLAEAVPVLWCAAEPSGPVTDRAFDRIVDMILEGVTQAGQIDGIFLDLHGAMVTERYADGEAELLARLRARVGRALPLGFRLDLHANLPAPLVALSDGLAVYRPAPHLAQAAPARLCHVPPLP